MGKTRGDVEFYDGTTKKSLVTELNRIDKDLEAAKTAVVVYGVAIDETNSNPDTAVTYIDGATGFTPATGNNGDYQAGTIESCFPFNKIRPCLFKNGAVVGYLNPNNFAQFENGSAADITSGSSGDVMIEIPHFYYKFQRSGSVLTVRVSNVKFDEGFTDFAFSYKGVVKDKFYVGAYLGYVDVNSKLRSLSGKTTTGSKTIGAFRTAAQANGDGYEQMPFNKITALQILYLLLFKSLNSQSALGQGYVSASAFHTSGVTDAKGMNYGTTGNSTTNDVVKCLGMEDFWGDKVYWLDGFMTGSSAIKIADGNFNDTADGYTSITGTGAAVSGAYFKTVVGSNELGFTPKAAGGSETTYFCDYGYIAQGSACVPGFGGDRTYGALAGAFQLYCGGSVSSSYTSFGARLTYCG